MKWNEMKWNPDHPFPLPGTTTFFLPLFLPLFLPSFLSFFLSFFSSFTHLAHSTQRNANPNLLARLLAFLYIYLLYLEASVTVTVTVTSTLEREKEGNLEDATSIMCAWFLDLDLDLVWVLGLGLFLVLVFVERMDGLHFTVLRSCALSSLSLSLWTRTCAFEAVRVSSLRLGTDRWPFI